MRGKKAQFGDFCTASGTIYSLGKIKIGTQVGFDGQLFARKGKIKLGEKLIGTVTPNLIILP